MAASETTETSAALVRLVDVDPSIQQDPRYAGPNNFVGSKINGYEARQVLLSREAALALAEAQRLARKRGLSLLVFDGYRPQRAVNHFVTWSQDLADTKNKSTYYPDVPKQALFDLGYIAAKSGHSRGSTVDLTLTADGRMLDMGTRFDWFGEASHTESALVSNEALANRLLLREIMSAAGFRNYKQEWWHYTLIDEPYPDTYFDLPIR